MIDEEIGWVEEVNAKFDQGIPEPAWDQAGELLDLLRDALAVIKDNPEAKAAFEKRRQR